MSIALVVIHLQGITAAAYPFQNLSCLFKVGKGFRVLLNYFDCSYVVFSIWLDFSYCIFSHLWHSETHTHTLSLENDQESSCYLNIAQYILEL